MNERFDMAEAVVFEQADLKRRAMRAIFKDISSTPSISVSSPNPTDGIAPIQRQGVAWAVMNEARINNEPLILQFLRDRRPEVRNAAATSLLQFIRKATKPMRFRLAVAILPYFRTTNPKLRTLVEQALSSVIMDFLEAHTFGYIVPFVLHYKVYLHDKAPSPLRLALRTALTLKPSLKLQLGLIGSGILEELDSFLKEDPVPQDIKFLLRHLLQDFANPIALTGRTPRILHLLQHPDNFISDLAKPALQRIFRIAETAMFFIDLPQILDQIRKEVLTLLPSRQWDPEWDGVPFFLIHGPSNMTVAFLRMVMSFRQPPFPEAVRRAFDTLLRSSPTADKDKRSVAGLRGGLISLLQSHQLEEPVRETAIPLLPALLDGWYSSLVDTQRAQAVRLLSHPDSYVREGSQRSFLRNMQSLTKSDPLSINSKTIPDVDFKLFLNELSHSPYDDCLVFVAKVLVLIGQDFGTFCKPKDGKYDEICDIVISLAEEAAKHPVSIVTTIAPPLLELTRSKDDGSLQPGAKLRENVVHAICLLSRTARRLGLFIEAGVLPVMVTSTSFFLSSSRFSAFEFLRTLPEQYWRADGFEIMLIEQIMDNLRRTSVPQTIRLTLKFCSQIYDLHKESSSSVYDGLLRNLCLKGPLFNLIRETNAEFVLFACDLVGKLGRTKEFRDMLLASGFDRALKEVASPLMLLRSNIKKSDDAEIKKQARKSAASALKVIRGA